VFDSELVFVCARLVFSLRFAHAGRVLQVLSLVFARTAELYDDLRGAGVQGVEVGPVLTRKAHLREVVDTVQPIHQLWTHLLQLVM